MTLRVVYTGKLKAGMKDDLVMTLLFTTFWAQQFLRKEVQARKLQNYFHQKQKTTNINFSIRIIYLNI